MKKFFKQFFIAAAVIILAVSCGNSPTNPSGGGANPTPNEFVDKLKSIGIVKAGEQEWNFRTLSQSGNVLTVKPMNNAKSGTLEGLDRYLSRKIDEITEVFKYEIEFLTADSTSSDGSEPNSPANSEALEAKITFEDKKTGSPITDAEFKDGFILKVEANANWIPTPEATEEDYKKSINQLGTINVNGKSGNTFAMDFAGLNVTKENEYNYTSELTIDANGKTDTIDLLDFVKAIESQISKSKTEYIEISDVYINSDNSFSISFNQVSANKVKKGSVTLKVKFNGNLSFAKRDLNVTITSTPEIVTDNSGKYKEAEFNVSTDVESISFQYTSIVEKTSTGIKIDYVSAHYSKKDGSATIEVSGDDILNAHKILTAEQTAEFEITFTARAEGYNDKTDLKMTLKMKKGNDLPVITLDEFNAWLNTIEVSGFTKQVSSAALTLTASSDISQDTALNNIKEALKKLSKDKIIINDNNISYLSWSTYPTGNKDGVINVYSVETAEGYAFSDDLYAILAANGSPRFNITVKPQSSWPSNISIEGAGSSSSNPLTINLGNGSANVQVPYKIKFINGASDGGYIEVSSLKQADSITDSWNLVGNQFFDSYTMSSVFEIQSYRIMNIVNNQNIQKNSSQVYKVTLTVSYIMNGPSIEEDIDLYVKFVKDYAVIDGIAMIKILIEGISGQPYDGVSSVSININDNVAMNITSPYYYGNNFTATDYNVSGQGSITYINNNIRLDNIKSALAKVGLNCTMASLTFTKKQGYDTIAAAVINNLSKADGYIFSDTAFNPSAGINIELTTSQTWLD